MLDVHTNSPQSDNKTGSTLRLPDKQMKLSQYCTGSEKLVYTAYSHQKGNFFYCSYGRMIRVPNKQRKSSVLFSVASIEIPRLLRADTITSTHRRIERDDIFLSL